jgi:hypothetical protein
LKTQIHKDNKELDNEKSKFIELIKKSKKEDLIPVKEKKLTLWQRIKKVLMG